MLSRGLVLRRVMLMAVLAAAMAAPKIVFAQAGGVAVDAAGVVQLKSTADQSGRLTKEQQAAARAGLNTQAAKRSTMRCISLKHLEKAIREKNGAITDEMRYLAGLLRVRYVFFYPDSGDIVIAGPAEGWTTDPAGRVIGISSGRPVIRLDDLCVALRAFPPSGSATKLIGCSIDPTKEGLAAMQRFLRSVGSNADPRDPQRTQFIVEGLQSNLGLQTGDGQRRLGQDALRRRDGRGRLSHEADRHWAGEAAGEAGQLGRSGQRGPDQPQRPGPLVLHARLPVRADQQRRLPRWNLWATA